MSVSPVRTQIQDALQRAGLHNTDYGRQIIMNAATAGNTRADNLTTEQRIRRLNLG